jgi:hypothetical protein
MEEVSIEPFVLVVLDHDKKEFSVEGPMLDNNPWNTANVKAKEAGRNINCSVRGGEPERSNVEAAPKACARQFRYRRVPAGAIVTLIDQCPPSSSR